MLASLVLTAQTILLLTGLIFMAALLYSSVGHAGASGYIAAMALCGVAPAIMKPTALVLNILVATIATVKFFRAGCFSWSLFWPFTVASVPAAFLGGAITLPAHFYKPAVGALLLFAALRLFLTAHSLAASVIRPLRLSAALLSGMTIGLLSGLRGTGGGIFLSPLLLYMGWAETRQTSGVSAAFILANSISGLLGHLSGVASLPAAIPCWGIAAAVGGWLGAEFGSKRLGNATLRRLLALVLVIAGLKMILT